MQSGSSGADLSWGGRSTQAASGAGGSADLHRVAHTSVSSQGNSGAQAGLSPMAATPNGRGMIKSSSVSTLMAATTLSDVGGMAPNHFGHWHPGSGAAAEAGAAYEQGMHAPPEMTAASLLLAAEPPRPHGRDMQSMPMAADMHSARSCSRGHATPDSGSRPPRRIGSAQDLASSSSRDKPVGGICKASAKGPTRASNRRANSRYAKDKSKAGSVEADLGELSKPIVLPEEPVMEKSDQQKQEENMEVRPVDHH